MKLVATLSIVSALIGALTTGPAGAQTLKKIRIGYPSLSFRQSNVWVAKETGIFNKYGLDVEPIFFGVDKWLPSSGRRRSPHRKHRHRSPGQSSGVQPRARGGGGNQYDQIVFARPGITKLEQLKGKNFGISGFGSATHYASTILVKHLNFDPKDLVLVPGGPDAERLGALSAGKIDATFFSSSGAPVARKAGFHELLQIADLGVEVQGNGFATSRDYIKSNRDTVKSALKGFVEAIYFIYANKKEAQRSSRSTCGPTIPRCSKIPTRAISR